MPNINKSEELITPISKGVVLSGNIFIVFFIFIVIMSLFIINTKKQYNVDVYVVNCGPSGIRSFCIIPEDVFNVSDVNSLFIEISGSVPVIIRDFFIKEVIFNKSRKDYVVEIQIPTKYLRENGEIIKLRGYLKSKDTTYGKLIFKI